MQRQTANTPQPDQKQAAPAAPLHEHPLTQIRRALGTRAGWRFIQAKLTVSQPGDQYEQEADRVADQVMRMPDHTAPATVRTGDLPQISRLQRMCAQCEEEEIQRQPMAEEMKGEAEEETLQAKETAGQTPQVGSDAQAQINGLRGGGQPLSEPMRAFFEPRFGHDFSRVRVHSDGRAAESASAVNALAFTLGQNVVFGSGRYAPNTVEGRNLLAHELTHVVQQTPFLSHKNPTIQRSPEEASSTATLSRTMIAEDSVEELAPGQMKKSEFLAELHTAVCQTAEEAIAGTGRSTEGCPYLDYWFGYYSGQDSQHIERAIHKYAPEASSVTTASEYISLIVARVRRSVEVWARTGEMMGVPEGVPTAMPETTPTASNEDSSAENRNIFFKGLAGGPVEGGDPRAIQAELGSGHTLDGNVKSRMESVFGVNFSGVRIHTDPTAQRLSSRLSARAFTLGGDIAFGGGEYQPGTLIGDALIAHELAHVLQQGNGNTSELQSKGGTEYTALEEDADISAVGAIVSAWGSVKGFLKDIGKEAMPRLRSGLQLQRCAAPAGVVALEAVGVGAAEATAVGATAAGTTATVGGITAADIIIPAAAVGAATTLESDSPTRTSVSAEETDTDILMTAAGNVVDQAIVDEAVGLAIALGLAATAGAVTHEILCQMLDRLAKLYRRTDKEKWKKIISTQKGKGCRRSRASK
jgi:Domain of unknown function (DUF4157)/Bacterial toxin 34